MYNCNECNWKGEYYQLTCIDVTNESLCPECGSDEVGPKEESFCGDCWGTGISPSGRIDNPCQRCKGTGVE